MVKKRLDELLVERELVETTDKAKRVIMAGNVFSQQERMDKPGMKVNDSIPLSVKGKDIPYVGRGGLKLEKALHVFNLSVSGKTMMDIGSSTGGFTDCALQNGARLCYAIDVGYNQLDWRLRNDDRVIVMERTNFRYVTQEMLGYGKPNMATIDVSFISVKKMLPVLRELLEANSDVIVLIKPQFEARREEVGEKGIIRDRTVHQRVVEEILGFAEQQGFQVHGLTHSPITGGDGNIEFLGHLGWEKEEERQKMSETLITTVVDEAHEALRAG
ncbi:TlyA family RNA methyltransferase [Virgibacillus xinjiangensis]|uniref:TlyA family RNA methyltransferase n=1 Tax=Virgibacillus xinjiangensis TaxID=393090 RepID=A0ABV7CRL9_9BACI